MVRLSFTGIWILIAALLVRGSYAQSTDSLLSQPIIHGEVNGMKVVAQGDAVVFMASKRYMMALDEEACARDLHCTLQKNRTEAVVLNPEGLWIYDSPPKQLPDNVIITEPLFPVSTEMDRLSNTAIEPTPTHIPLEFPQPTATLHTGNEVVDKTPGILLVSSPVMTWLAETVTTVSHSRQAMDSDESLSPIIEPTPTQQKVMLTTITEEEDELLRKLTSTSTMPMPTSTPALVENRLWEDGSIWLEMDTDILTIKPSPSGHYGSRSETTHSFTFSVKQVPTVTEGSTSGNRETASSTSTEAQASAIETLQPSGLPASQQETGGATKAATKLTIKEKQIALFDLEVPSSTLKGEEMHTVFPDKYFENPEVYEKNLTLAERIKRLSIAMGYRLFIAHKDAFKNDKEHFIFWYVNKFNGKGDTVPDDLPERVDVDAVIKLPTPAEQFAASPKGHLSPLELEMHELLLKIGRRPHTNSHWSLESNEQYTASLREEQAKHDKKLTEIATDPDHLPFLTLEEMLKIGRRATHWNSLTYCTCCSQWPLFERSSEAELQAMFARGGILEQWRYIPAYTADQKRELLMLEEKLNHPNLSEEEVSELHEDLYSQSDYGIHDDNSDDSVYKIEQSLKQAGVLPSDPPQ